MANQLPPDPYSAPGQPFQKPAKPVSTSLNGLAIASLVLGVLSVVLSCFTGLIGVILGVVSLVQIGGSGGRQTGKGLAITGIILSIVLSMLVPFAMFLPAVAQVRQAARSTMNMNNMRQIVLAQMNYESATRALPTNSAGLSWRVHILPFTENHELYSRFNLEEPWDSPTNIQLLDQMPDVYKNAMLPNLAPGKTTFLRPIGNGAFPTDKTIGFSDITDGLSNTIFLVSVNSNAAVNWTEPVDYHYDPNDPRKDLAETNMHRYSIALADGSTYQLDDGVSQEDLKAKFTIGAGDGF